ncbi:MAG: hypothetical protein HC772_09935 [Leptolyngbyaceae cyanobacterium CRU_2_3]|nr:hypothetical protein [Leptolyngbyaceae cyanobacterium CRU_2_3]
MNESPRQVGFYQRLFGMSVASLPYLSYVSFVGIGVVLIYLLKTFKRSPLDSFTRNGLLVITGCMGLSCLFSVDRGEAFLQLTNYLPFFLFFAFLPYVFEERRTFGATSLWSGHQRHSPESAGVRRIPTQS